MSLKRHGLIFAGFLIVALALIVAPVSAAVITINNDTGALAAAIGAASTGDTIILNPGTYFEHGITIPTNITIEANTTYGGSPANTIIDAQSLGGIFTVSGANSLSLDNLTMRNGHAADYGGVIFFYSTGSLTITSSTFTDCSATGVRSGVIYSLGSTGSLTITSSTFTDCSVTGTASAVIVLQDTGSLTITSSTFTRCSSNFYGGAIFANSGSTTTITTSTFTGCTAPNGGAIYSNGQLTITSSTFTDCSSLSGNGASGGAIFSDNGGTITITSSTFTGCTAPNGGAISTGGYAGTITSSTFTDCSATSYISGGGAILSTGAYPTLNIDNSTFTGCSANSGSGGAIHHEESFGGSLNIDSSTFTDCSAGTLGGAIYSSGSNPTLNIDTSTFTGCSATNFGGAIWSNSGTANIHFSRIYQDGSDPVDGHGSGNIDDNWWGTNSGPLGSVSGFLVNSWLVLGATATPSSINPSQTSAIQANLTYDSNGGYHDPASGSVPDGIPVSFTLGGGSGSLVPLAGNMTSGTFMTTFSPEAIGGITTVDATVDGQQVSTGVAVLVAGSSGMPRSGMSPLSVTFTDLSTGSPTEWNWSFGDGQWFNTTDPTLNNPTHIYNNAGIYTVSLTVQKDGITDTVSQAGYITVTAPPPPAVTGITPATGINTTTVSITDLSGTNFASGANVMLTPVNSNPVHKGSIVDGAGGALLGNPLSVYVSGNYAYVASQSSGALEIVDVSNPANPVHKGSISNGAGGALLGDPHGVYVSGNYAYITSWGSNALEIVDVSNPANPVHKGSIVDGTGGALLNYPYGVYVSGNYAYVANYGSGALEIVDVSNPANPVHKGSIVDGAGGALLNGPCGVYVSGNYAYVTSAGSNALEVVDVSNPANPVHKGSISNGAGGALLGNPHGVYVSGNYAYVASRGSNALEIVDVSNPANPVHVGSMVDGAGGALLNSPYGVYVSGNYAYVASRGSNALEIVDVSNPANPVHVGSMVDGAGGALLRYPVRVYVSGNYAYVASEGSNALEIVDTGSITPSGVNVISPTSITGTFDLTNRTAGLYNVVVINPDGTFGMLANGFTVTAPPAPAFVSSTTNTAGTAINITFDKAMTSPAGSANQFTYSVNGGTAQPFGAAALESNPAIIDLTTSGTAIANGDMVTVNYTGTSVTSTDGGVLAAFNNQAVTNNVPTSILAPPETPAPTFVSATTNTAGTAINITFDKAMTSPAGSANQFTYSINGGTAQPFSAAALESNPAVIDLTTSGTAVANGDMVTVNYTGTSVTSTDGGVLAAFSNQAVTNNVPGPAPTQTRTPVSPSVITINNGTATALSDAVRSATSGETIILNPGTYFEHGIAVPTDITLRANTTYGGSPANTILDAQSLGTILSVSGSSSLTLDNLTLTNGNGGTNWGGAIYSTTSGPVTITSSRFANCWALQASGGAIYSGYGTLTVTSSTFTNCSAEQGGAIESHGGPLTVTSSTFTNCSANTPATIDSAGGAAAGGAISSTSPLTVTSSTFTNCSSSYFGGAIYTISSSDTITSSTFTGCSSTYYGGAIYSDTGSPLTIISSTFTNCSTTYDGAIEVVSEETGGAIYSTSPLTITSSAFTGCSAPEGGGAISTWDGSAPVSLTMHFSRIYEDGSAAVKATTGNVDDNWWGTNSGPGGALGPSGDLASGIPVNSWLVLGATATPSSINPSQTSVIQANLTYDSNGGYHDPASGYVPDGIPVAFTLGSGSILPLEGNMTTGMNTTVFSPGPTGGMTTIDTTVDGQTVSTGVSVSTPALTGPTVTGITPATGINTTTVSITDLSGTNFASGANVMLTPVNSLPVHKGSIVDGTGGALLSSPSSVYVSGNYAYVGSVSSNSLEIVDISNPANPVHKGSIADGAGGALLSSPESVYVSGNYAYVGSYGSNALEIVDVSNPANPVHKGSIADGAGGALLKGPMSVYVSGNYAYVASHNSGALEIVDISNPANPVHKGSIAGGAGVALLNSPTRVYVSGNYAYVTSSGINNALEIVDVSNPANPVHKGSIVDGTGGALLSIPYTVYVSGNYAYVGSAGSNALEIVDVSNPANPVHKGSIADGAGGALLKWPNSVCVSGNYAYVASMDSSALEIVDVSNPANPVHKGSIVNGTGGALLYYPTSVCMSGNYAYVASGGSNALEILDVGSVPATSVNVVSPTSITGTFDLTNRMAGMYNVVVINPDGTFGTLSNGFTVTAPVQTPPTFISAMTNTAGTAINITFDKAMASPAGSANQFTYSINGGTAQPFGAAALESNPAIIDLTTSGTAIANGDMVTINYTGTSVTSNDGGVLTSFNNWAVTNTVPGPMPTPTPSPTPPATPAPVATFTGVPTSGTVPLTVSFTDQSTGSPTGWAWFFGDENYTEPWTQMTASAGWSPRSGHSSVAMPDGSIVLMGSYYYTESGDTIIKNDVWRSTDNGATWTQMTAHAGWSGRCEQGSVVMPDGSIVLMGGVSNDMPYNYTNDVWRSTDNGATWTQMTANAGWAVRSQFSSVAMPDGSIVLMGGTGIMGALYNDVWRSTDDGATWTQVTVHAGWSARSGHSSVAMPDGSIVLMGGQTLTAGNGFLNDVWRSTDNGATWTQMSLTPMGNNPGWTARRDFSSVVMPDGSIVLMGGSGSFFLHDVWRSTNNGVTWTQLPDPGWSPRTLLSSVAMPDGSIILTGGYDGIAKNDVWRFMPVGSSTKNPSHVYTMPGTYQVALQAFNTGGYNSMQKTGYITVTAPVVAPVAAFSASATSGTAPLTVQFNDTSTGDPPTMWNWSFGNSIWFNTTDSLERNASYTYNSPGTFMVSLTASNTGGSDTVSRSGYITVTAPVTAPTFISAMTNTAGTEINITFDKAMASPAGSANQFTYSINGGTAQPFSAAVLDSNTAIIDLTTSGTVIANGDMITVNYTGTSVTSTDGGILAAFNNQAVTNDVSASILAPTETPVPPPTFVSATTNTAGTSINITFDKAMTSPAGFANQFTYSINGGTAQPFSAAVLDSNPDIIDLTPSGTAIAHGNTITVNYTGPSVTSTDGGILAAFSNRAVTNTVTAPTPTPTPTPTLTPTPVPTPIPTNLLAPGVSSITRGEDFSIQIPGLSNGNLFNLSISSTNLRNTTESGYELQNYTMPFGLQHGTATLDATGTNVNNLGMVVTVGGTTASYSQTGGPIIHITSNHDINKETYNLIRITGAPYNPGTDVGISLWANGSVVNTADFPATLQFTFQGASAGDVTIALYSGNTLVDSWTLHIVTPAGLVGSATTQTPELTTGATTTLDFSSQTGTTLGLTTSNSVPAGTTVTVTKYTDPTDLTASEAAAEGNPQTPSTANLPTSTGTTYTAFPGKYIVIDAPGLSGNIGTMFINISYTQSDLTAAGLSSADEANLRVFTWNSGTSKWEPLDPSGDDAVNKVIWGVTHHLSIYGVIAVASSSSTSTSTSISTGGGGGGGGGGGVVAPAVVPAPVQQPGLLAPPQAVTTITTAVPGKGPLTSGPVTGNLEGMEGITASWTTDIVEQPTAGASITTSLIQNPSDQVMSAYQTALQQNGLDVAAIAYLMSIQKTGITSTGSATILMSVSPNWVTDNGGNDAMRIMRIGDDGTVQILPTAFSNYDANTGYLTFTATSPDGMCTFGIVAVKAYVPVATQATQQSALAPVQTPAAGTSGGFPYTAPIIGAVVIIVIVGVIAYFSRKTGKK